LISTSDPAHQQLAREGGPHPPGAWPHQPTNQAQPPLFQAIATNVKAKKRVLGTIVRRQGGALESLLRKLPQCP
jgi:hypothetical protein